MRISDWSSDVCSSDLFPGKGAVEIDDVQVRRARIGEQPRLRRGIVAIDSRARHIAFSKPHHLPALEVDRGEDGQGRSEEHTSELQSLMRISYAVFCLKKKKKTNNILQQNQKDN